MSIRKCELQRSWMIFFLFHLRHWEAMKHARRLEKRRAMSWEAMSHKTLHLRSMLRSHEIIHIKEFRRKIQLRGLAVKMMSVVLFLARCNFTSLMRLLKTKFLHKKNRVEWKTFAFIVQAKWVPRPSFSLALFFSTRKSIRINSGTRAIEKSFVTPSVTKGPFNCVFSFDLKSHARLCIWLFIR